MQVLKLGWSLYCVIFGYNSLILSVHLCCVKVLQNRKSTYAMFLDGHISEMYKHVIQFTCAGRVLHCAEPTEAKLVPESTTPDRTR